MTWQLSLQSVSSACSSTSASRSSSASSSSNCVPAVTQRLAPTRSSQEPEGSTNKCAPQQNLKIYSERRSAHDCRHNNPDADCLASALALGRIAAAVGIDERRILYSGEISHPQPARSSSAGDGPAGRRADVIDRDPRYFARRRLDSGANNRVPDDVSVDIVVDHHPAEDIQPVRRPPC